MPRLMGTVVHGHSEYHDALYDFLCELRSESEDAVGVHLPFGCGDEMDFSEWWPLLCMAGATLHYGDAVGDCVPTVSIHYSGRPEHLIRTARAIVNNWRDYFDG